MCQLTLLLILSKLKQLLWEQAGPVDETSVSKRVYINIDIYNLSLTGYTHPVTITMSKLGDIWLLSGIVSSLQQFASSDFFKFPAYHAKATVNKFSNIMITTATNVDDLWLIMIESRRC